ncbi:MAG TPA: hypothetical protein PKH58_01395 [Paludibacteraceae bacterium]|nr:hypothetical protein [Paludibacteraceae bacterium]
MAENININLTVEAWADIVIMEWIKKFEALGIRELHGIHSFESSIITASDGDPAKVRFAFEWYLKMVDYGVGKYVNLETRDTMIAAGLTTRRPKPWFSDTFYKQLSVLHHLYEEKYAKKTELFIVRNLKDNADLGFNEVAL